MYAPPSQASSKGKQLVNVVVLFVLVIALLVVLTKFHFIHPRDIPGWQGFYCGVIERAPSRIAIVYGDDGAGDPEKLENLIAHAKPNSAPTRIPLQEISAGLLKNYDVVFLDRARTITFAQAAALQSFLDGGGNLVWQADSASNYAVTPEELAEALSLNASKPGYYEKFLKKVNNTKGFGELGSLYAGISFVRAETASPNLVLRVVDSGSLLGSGVGFAPEGSAPGMPRELPLGSMSPGLPYAVVNEKPSGAVAGSTKVAVLVLGGNQSYPAIIDTKYVSRIVYVAFPLEMISDKMTGLLNNVLDYLVAC
ncbi:MAG: hypothetical protein ACP5O3_00495 [Candidatus Micrarchaeia archaeon]|jgi:hypothetical protein